MGTWSFRQCRVGAQAAPPPQPSSASSPQSVLCLLLWRRYHALHHWASRGCRTCGLHNFQHLPLQWVFTSGSQHGLCGLLGTFLPGKILLCPASTLIHYFPTSVLFVRGEWLRGAGFHCCQHRIHRKRCIAGEVVRTGPSWFLTFENGTRRESRQ